MAHLHGQCIIYFVLAILVGLGFEQDFLILMQNTSVVEFTPQSFVHTVVSFVFLWTIVLLLYSQLHIMKKTNVVRNIKEKGKGPMELPAPSVLHTLLPYFKWEAFRESEGHVLWATGNINTKSLQGQTVKRHNQNVVKKKNKCLLFHFWSIVSNPATSQINGQNNNKQRL